MFKFSGAKPILTLIGGRVEVITEDEYTAPLNESKLKVLLEVRGGDSTDDRPGLDLVAVLDVSESMDGDKLEKMKTAILFVIKKLTPIDRLSIVTFSDTASIVSELCPISEKSQKNLEKLVNGLKVESGTNILNGLIVGLEVVNKPGRSSDRVAGIMLMSDGEQTAGDAATFTKAVVPVFTFGLGSNHDPVVLKAIADNNNGTFSDVQKTDNLSKAFSACLAGLVTVVVEDLKLTISQVVDESRIEHVSAGSYPKCKDDAAGSVTISFGELYSKEERKVVVDLLLPAVTDGYDADVLKITYSYSFKGQRPIPPPPSILFAKRAGTNQEQQMSSKLLAEVTRISTAQEMKNARILADDGGETKTTMAKNKLIYAQNKLKEADKSDPIIQMLQSEIQQLIGLMEKEIIYQEQGRSFALSSETSHDRQRFATRGDDIDNVKLFATPRMEKYIEQAKLFDKDPEKPPHSAEEDVKKEITANSLPPVAGVSSFYIKAAIQSLQSAERFISRGKDIYIEKAMNSLDEAVQCIESVKKAVS
ncbi:E3 ubiquitin-protein ligase WAV3-like [Mercurialis annua]|uniref:E3 ubiquitin-protein ligase WAV3-like n=1 Tax=Mercurialis annua TaxID=3986 RepID=UPI002160FF51|nr:E3 ubiquitin-protein ligase WAV3-like [Mercurialis annua]